jgi:hypothetical protein
MRSVHLFVAAALWFCAGIAAAQEPPIPEDPRQLVTMPAISQAVLREEMIDNMGALHEILALLAQNKLKEAADIAEQRLGRSSMGKHAARTRGQGPGRYMPDAMRGIGLTMHDAASEFANTARSGDQAKAYAALQQVTANCVACHAAYRTR